jgi:hypothetical protein
MHYQIMFAAARCLAVSALLSLVCASQAFAQTAFASYVLGRGPVTFGMALPQGAATTGIQIGNLSTQTDVKTRWQDGSIRFAAVSAEIATAGRFDVHEGPPGGAPLTPSWPTVVLELVINGVTWAASPRAFDGSDSWLAGQVVREARRLVVPTNGGVNHPQLEAIFDMRSYAGGSHRIDVTLQNVRDAVTMDKVAVSAVSLKVNGSVIWSHGAVTSYSMTRWRHVEWVGATEASIVPDFEPTYRSGALPRILTTVANRSYDVTGPAYDLMGGRPSTGYPFAYGEMNPDMAAGGGRREIGALNWWEAEYLVHKTANLRTTVLRNADLTGAWSSHLAKADGTMIKLGEPGYPSSWWWDTRSPAGHRPLAPHNPETNWQGAREGLSPASDTGGAGVASRYNEEHVPAPMFVAYLLTGDRFYVDQGKFWATRAILGSTPFWLEPDEVNFPGWKRGRNGPGGNDRILDMSGMSREFAWPLRLVAYTAWMIPDGDSDKSYFRATVQNNLDHAGAYYDTWVRLGYGGALGAMAFEENASAGISRNGVVTGRFGSTWRMTYTLFSVDWCTMQGMWNISPSVTGFVNRIVNLQIQLNIQNPNFLTGEAGLSFNGYPVFNTMADGRFTKWFDTFAELKYHNENYPYADGDLGFAQGWNRNMPSTGYYNVEHWMALQIGLRRGHPNAVNALERLEHVPGVISDINGRAGFAITFEPSQSTERSAPQAPSNVRLVP